MLVQRTDDPSQQPTSWCGCTHLIFIMTDTPDIYFGPKAIDTLAYQYTRPAPKKTVPRSNVIIRLCSIECNFALPFSDPSNAPFQKVSVLVSIVCSVSASTPEDWGVRGVWWLFVRWWLLVLLASPKNARMIHAILCFFGSMF